MSIEVVALNFYPIKSCGGSTVNELAVTETGLLHDREWMVVDADGGFMSQRKNPEMALITPVIDGDSLRVDAPRMDTLAVPIARATEDTLDVTVHKNPVKAQSVGREADEWFSDFLDTKVRLVRPYPNAPRQIAERYRTEQGSSRVNFADSFAMLLASEASLVKLNASLYTPIPMNRFRPNIVVGGLELDAYDEDFWREIRIGSMKAFVVRACSRCPIPDTDQATGLRPDRPVTEALKATRHGIDITDPKKSQGNFFGQNVQHIVEVGQTIAVGDAVEIIDRASQRNFM